MLGTRLMHRVARTFPLLLCTFWIAEPLRAQLPFYIDDAAVTERGKWHFEFFDEFDVLQLQYPNVRQNTANYKLNYGLPFHLELDVDSPYLAIFRAVGTQGSRGGGDTNLGVKWEFHKESHDSWVPALGASLYIEFPTGDATQQLGSGLTDYWLNLIAQKSLSDKTRVNMNLGYLFAGNSSTGVLGIQNTRGHVYIGGLSMLYDFIARMTLGGETYGGFTNKWESGQKPIPGPGPRSIPAPQWNDVRFWVPGGKFIASPRIGAQVGFSVDFPDVLHKQAPD
jgi:hypothetical protein